MVVWFTGQFLIFYQKLNSVLDVFLRQQYLFQVVNLLTFC